MHWPVYQERARETWRRLLEEDARGVFGALHITRHPEQ
jgi:hypothetical protein